MRIPRKQKKLEKKANKILDGLTITFDHPLNFVFSTIPKDCVFEYNKLTSDLLEEYLIVGEK